MGRDVYPARVPIVTTPTEMNFKGGAQATGAVMKNGQNRIVID